LFASLGATENLQLKARQPRDIERRSHGIQKAGLLEVNRPARVQDGLSRKKKTDDECREVVMLRDFWDFCTRPKRRAKDLLSVSVGFTLRTDIVSLASLRHMDVPIKSFDLARNTPVD
jgi:hypothetical protein